MQNPLYGLSHEMVVAMGTDFAKSKGLEEYTSELVKGALVAQDPSSFERLAELDESDKVALRREISHKWDQPRVLWYLVITCSMAAAVQGVCTIFSYLLDRC